MKECVCVCVCVREREREREQRELIVSRGVMFMGDKIYSMPFECLI